ncbi:hypothetical protein [Bradyrhizobium sp. S3.7.6]
MQVDITTYSDADCVLTQTVAFSIGSNPLHMQVRSTATDATVQIDLTTVNGMIAVSGAGSNVVTVTIPQNKLRDLPPGPYVHSCIMSSGGGNSRTEVWRGSLTHNAGPTQWDAGTP